MVIQAIIYFKSSHTLFKSWDKAGPFRQAWGSKYLLVEFAEEKWHVTSKELSLHGLKTPDMFSYEVQFLRICSLDMLT